MLSPWAKSWRLRLCINFWSGEGGRPLSPSLFFFFLKCDFEWEVGIVLASVSKPFLFSPSFLLLLSASFWVRGDGDFTFLSFLSLFPSPRSSLHVRTWCGSRGMLLANSQAFGALTPAIWPTLSIFGLAIGSGASGNLAFSSYNGVSTFLDSQHDKVEGESLHFLTCCGQKRVGKQKKQIFALNHEILVPLDGEIVMCSPNVVETHFIKL